MDDEKLISQLSDPATRRKAFAQLVNDYGQLLYWKIRGIVLTHEDADDILQNTFLKAWTKLDSFQGNSKLSTWLYRIAVNESLDFLRKQKVRQQMAGEFDTKVASRLMADDYFDGDRGKALLHEAVSKLPAVQQAVFQMRYFQEMHYKEISEVMNATEGALKASYHIAVKKITEYIQRHD